MSRGGADAIACQAQVPDQELVERVTGRRLDPQTGLIYHLKFKPPPAEALERLIQRSDDTEAKLRNRLDTHHANVAAVLGYYKDITVEVLPHCPQAVFHAAHAAVCGGMRVAASWTGNPWAVCRVRHG